MKKWVGGITLAKIPDLCSRKRVIGGDGNHGPQAPFRSYTSITGSEQDGKISHVSSVRRLRGGCTGLYWQVLPNTEDQQGQEEL
ncbi:uncharacterized [Tachysurus ichikawai]